MMPRVRSQRIGEEVGSAGTTSSPRRSTRGATEATAAGATAKVTVVRSWARSRATVGAPALVSRTTTATSASAVATWVVGRSANGLAASE
jgi:hypothetical protein